MQLSNNDLYLLKQCAISAAYQAGQMISQYANRSVTVQTKQGGESRASQVVTEVDHLSQAVILETLLPSCSRFDLGLLTEETPDDGSRLEKDFFWCIDPLDGTLSFIESLPGYAVSIALVSRAGRSLIGVVYDPLDQTLYCAAQGSGAFRNRVAVDAQVSKPLPEQRLIGITDRSFADHPHCETFRAELDNIALNLGYAGAQLVLQGGAAMNACRVLEKSPACYFKFPKTREGGGSIWDYAATDCLFQEAGAAVSDIHGHPFQLNPSASIFMNHCGVLYSSTPEIAEQVTASYRRLCE